MPSVTRSGRTVKNSSNRQDKLDALERLDRIRRGEKLEIEVKEEPSLFEEVDPEEYKRTRKGGFVVDYESDEEYDSDRSFIDDDDFTEEKKKGGSKRKDKTFDVDSRQRSMKSFLCSKEKSSIGSHPLGPSSSSSSKKKEINEDDILNQMLYDVPVNRASSAQKPLKVMSRLTTTPKQASLKTKAIYDPISTKRPRLLSPGRPAPPKPSESEGAPPLDSWPDDFEDSVPMPIDLKALEKRQKIDPIFEQMSTQESISDKEVDHENDFIEAAPLNEDLRSNLDFHREDGKEFTRFYWYDCCEDQIKSPGVVYFFGRIYTVTAKRYVSTCVIVKNVPRTCYLLIKHSCTYEEVVGEISNVIAKRFRIKNFTCEKVTRKYAFSSESSVPLVADYVKLEYSYNQPCLPDNLNGETFSHVLNSSQTPMEKIILDLKLRGPCWLKLYDPVTAKSQLTWTRIELIVDSPENLVVQDNPDKIGAPYFCSLSLYIRTYPNPIKNQNEILAIACMVNTAFNLDECLKRNNKASGHFLIMTKPSPANKELKLPYDFQAMMKKYTKTRFQLVDNERDLLAKFMERFYELDPDIVVGHDLLNFDFEILVTRMKSCKLGMWSQLGRFRRSELPATKAAFRYMFSGRIMCDIRISAMELIKARSYDLTELASQVLEKTRLDYNHSTIVEAYKTSDNLIKMINATWEDNDTIFSILVELNIIPLALKITNITGNILSRTLTAGRSERNEYLLLHAFHEANFICPEKRVSNYKRGNFNKAKSDVSKDDYVPTRKKAAYAGGLVLEPKAGYYDSCILLMDFNSLYPSIIQEYNICFSTVKRPEQLQDDGEVIASVPNESVETGVLPSQLKNLVDGRRRVKRLLAESKNPAQKMLLDIEQKALKLTANSMYGCLGFENSRFYAKHLASLVTFKGREILMSTKAMVEKLGYDVIYGDTDSLMIDTKIVEYDEVIQRGISIKAEINRTFKLLEIDIDGVYRPLLLLKKKNYAGTSLKKAQTGDQLIRSIETKGLDTVRRDRAVIAKEAGERVLSMILACDKDITEIVEDIHNYLKELGNNIISGQYPVEKYLISKQLNRNPDEYKGVKGLGHITLALRHNADPKKTKKLKAGDTVEYVICCDNTSESPNQRAYTLEELATNETLKLDTEYYLCQQIHPVLSRICDKLPITNAYVLAEMLGIEKSHLLHLRRDDTDGTRRDQLISKGASRFDSCKPLVIHCPNCNLPEQISTRTRRNKNKKLELSLTQCTQCGSRFAIRMKHVVSQIIAQIRQMTLDLYNTRYICENNDCDFSTRNVFGPLSMDEDDGSSVKSQPMCQSCASSMLPEFDDRTMDLQLSYMKHLFDANRERDSNELLDPPAEDLMEMYEMCSKEVGYALRCSFVNNIDAHSMFSMVCSSKAIASTDD